MKSGEKKILRTVTAAAVGLVLLAACGESRPDYVLSESRMVSVLCDYHIAKAMGEADGVESDKTPYYIMSAFRKNNVTEAQFDSTLAYYSARPQMMDEVYTEVRKRLQTERDGVHRLLMARDNRSSGTVRGDRVDIWPGMQMFSLNGTEYNDKVTFNFTNDRNFEGRDTIRLSARFRFYDGPPDYATPAVMAISIKYKNDSIIGRTANIANDGVQTIQLYNDTLGDIREVNGFIYFPRQQQPSVMLVDRITMMRLHAKSPAR